ncbi:MAG: hypothetical protein HRT47_02725 [Candidatus Caenarcaniphilales bacterium]|nr:hypothetical protein [Candidatus Caenarcaniphilales bacterium]
MNILKNKSQLTLSEQVEEFVLTQKLKIKLGLLVLILILISLSLAEYFSLKNKLKLANRYETVLVLAAKENLSAGKSLSLDLIEFIPYSLKKINELESMHGDIFFKEKDLELIKKDLSKALIKKDLLSGDLIRKNLIANDSTDIVTKLLPDNHSILDLSLDFAGTKKYLKTGDRVKLYRKSKKMSSKKFNHSGQIILLKKTNDEQLSISLAIPNSIFKEVLSAHNAKELELVIEKEASKTANFKTTQLGFQKLLVNNSKHIKVYSL